MSDYDREVEAIQAYNQPLLNAFQMWLEESGLSKKTVEGHSVRLSHTHALQSAGLRSGSTASQRRGIDA